MSACVPVIKTRPRSSVYLSSSEAAARTAGSTGAFIHGPQKLCSCGRATAWDCVPCGGRRVAWLSCFSRSDAGLRPRYGAIPALPAVVPVRLRPEGVGQDIDKDARLRRQEPAM